MADQDRVVLFLGAGFEQGREGDVAPADTCEQGCQGDVAPADTWNMHGAECNSTGDDTCPDDWSLPDEGGSIEGGDDGAKFARPRVPLPMPRELPQARSPMYEPSLSADEDDHEGDSDDFSEAAVVKAALPSTDNSAEAALVTDETAQVSTGVPSTDLDSKVPLSVLLKSVRGSPRIISDKEQLPALLISGPYGRGASPREVADKVSFASDVASRVVILDSAAAQDATKPGSPGLLESSSVDVAVQQEGQGQKASESLDEPSATVPVEEPAGGGSPHQWAGIDRDSLRHISNMNLRPPRSRRTRQRSVPGTSHQGGATRSSGGSGGGTLLTAGAMGKRVEELLLW